MTPYAFLTSALDDEMVTRFCAHFKQTHVLTYDASNTESFDDACAKVGEALVVAFSKSARLFAERQVNARGAIFLGYPFHKRGDPKNAHGLRALKRFEGRALIVQGERDAHGSASFARRALGERNEIELCVIPDGNHRFLPRAKSGLLPADSWRLVYESVERFSAQLD